MQNNFFKKLYQFTCIFLLSFTLITGFLSTLYFRQLTSDGIRMALNVINYGHLNIEFPFYRFSTLLIQAPAILIDKLLHNPFMTTWFFCLSYFLFPFLLIAGIKLSFFKKNNKEILNLFIAILFICILPSSAFSVSVVNESICIALIMFAYAISSKQPHWCLILGLTVALLYSYELGIIFFPLILYILSREKKLNHYISFILAAGILLQLSNLGIRLLPLKEHTTYLHTSFLNWFTWQLVNALVFVIGMLIISIVKQVRFFYFYVLCAAFLLISEFCWEKYYYLNWQAYFDRMWAIPLAAIILLIGYELFYRKDKLNDHRLLQLILLCSLPTATKEAIHSYQHYQYVTRLDKLIQTSKGCISLSREQMDAIFPTSIRSDMALLPLWSIVRQKTFEPKIFLYSSLNVADGKNKVPECNFFSKGQLRVSTPTSVMTFSTTNRINFQYIVK